MKSKHYLALLGGIVLGLSSASAMATDGAPARPTPEQMQAVAACAAAKGVDLPAPPAGGPPKGEKPADGEAKAPPADGEAPPPPPKDGEGGGEGKGPQGGPPKLTAEQKAIVDACFAAQGLTPPKAPPAGGKGGEHKAPPSDSSSSSSSDGSTSSTTTTTGAKTTKSKVTGTVK